MSMPQISKKTNAWEGWAVAENLETNAECKKTKITDKKYGENHAA